MAKSKKSKFATAKSIVDTTAAVTQAVLEAAQASPYKELNTPVGKMSPSDIVILTVMGVLFAENGPNTLFAAMGYTRDENPSLGAALDAAHDAWSRTV